MAFKDTVKCSHFPCLWHLPLAQRTKSRIHQKQCATTCGGLARSGNECQTKRERDAIYRYLEAVYCLVAWWAVEGKDTDRARRALRLQRLEVVDREDPFAAIIRCTADPVKVDKRTRSKWSRVMRYAARCKDDAEPLAQFVKRKGGINECAVRYSRLLGGVV
jgi:hypothetical protein